MDRNIDAVDWNCERHVPTTGSGERIDLKSYGTNEVDLMHGVYNVSVEPLLVESKSKVDGPTDYLKHRMLV